MHDLETYRDMASFASRREVAWHGLGTVFQDDVTTEQMLDLANLSGWNVRLEPNTFDGLDTVDLFNVVRDNPFGLGVERLGTVGKRYKVVQNEDVLSFGDYMLDGGRWETAGSIAKGKRIFASLALERETVLDPSGIADKVVHYLMLTSSHDGSGAVRADRTSVRPVCSNTVSAALASSAGHFKIRHTTSLEGKVQAAREALNIAHTSLDMWDIAARELFETPMTMDQIDNAYNAAFPEKDADNKRGTTVRENHKDEFFAILASNTSEGVDRNAWGVWNAFVEQLDWFRTPKNGEMESVLMASSGLSDVTEKEKSRLLSVVKAFA